MPRNYFKWTLYRAACTGYTNLEERFVIQSKYDFRQPQLLRVEYVRARLCKLGIIHNAIRSSIAPHRDREDRYVVPVDLAWDGVRDCKRAS
jgi:hypothetical protein